MTLQEQLAHWEKLWAIQKHISNVNTFANLGFTVLQHDDSQLGSVRGFVKDGMIFMLKADITDLYASRVATNPVAASLDKFIDDVKAVSRRNPYVIKYLAESEHVIVFEFEGFAPITKSNIDDIDVKFALRRFTTFYKQSNDVVRVFTPEKLFYNPLTKEVKIVDVFGLWYHSVDPAYNIDLFPMTFDDRIVVYTFNRQLSRDAQLSMEVMRKEAETEFHQELQLIYV